MTSTLLTVINLVSVVAAGNVAGAVTVLVDIFVEFLETSLHRLARNVLL